MARIKYPQAIAFGADFGVIMLDKEVWSSEMIVVKRGDDMGEMLYDESVNWEDDPRGGPDHPLRVPYGGLRAVANRFSRWRRSMLAQPQQKGAGRHHLQTLGCFCTLIGRIGSD